MMEATSHALNVSKAGRRWGARQLAWLLLEAAITAGAVALVVRGIGLQETGHAFRDADYRWFVPAAVFLFGDFQLRALRWRLLLGAGRGTSHNNLFGVQNVGYLVSNVFPFRAGEVARVLLIDELEKTGKVRAAASVFCERLIDVLAMVLLLVALFPFVDEPAWATGPVLLVGAAAVTGAAALLVLSHLNDHGAAFWKDWIVQRLPKGALLEDLLNTALQSLRPLRRAAGVAPIVLLTAVIWTSAALSFYMVMKAFRVGGGMEVAAFVLAATTLSMVVPSSPGYVGVFHAVAVETLVEVFGVDRETALSYAVGQHGLIYLMPAALGSIFLLTHRGLWRDLAQSLRPGAREHILEQEPLAAAEPQTVTHPAAPE
jgi:uncharacterized membrane protein YbhN (UPF0104 family)